MMDAPACPGESSLPVDPDTQNADVNETSCLQSHFANLSLDRASEIVIGDDGHPDLPPGTQHANPDEQVLQDAHSSIAIYIIRSPLGLQNFLSTISLGSIKIIRLVLLHQLELGSLTEEEQMGGVGPNITPWFAAWKNAFKSIPPDIQLIQVDISHSSQLRTLMLGKLAQHLSTTVHLRSGGKTRFAVVGARTTDGKAFIEGSMIGLIKDADKLGGPGKLKIGAE